MDNGDPKGSDKNPEEEEGSQDEQKLTPAQKLAERARKQFQGPGHEKRG